MAEHIATLTVTVVQKEDGGVKSAHRYTSELDEREALSWPSGGLNQTTYAMTLEALRRESYTMAIALLSQGTPEEKLTAKMIEDRVRTHMAEQIDRMAGFCSEEALKMVQPTPKSADTGS